MRIDKRMLDDIPAWLEKQEDIPSRDAAWGDFNILADAERYEDIIRNFLFRVNFLELMA